jgi:4-hydroxy-3-methylbut-2-enyl diphosphate reductase
MKAEIKIGSEIGFCFGVQRAIDILQKEIKIYGHLETFGAVVHNEQVMQKLSDIGIDVVQNIDDIKSQVIAISSHGIEPLIENELRKNNIKVIDTTCPFVRRAQNSARKLSDSGYFVVIYGEAQHSEVKGILGWAGGKGLATLDSSDINMAQNLTKRIGILSQTTQIPENFIEFVKKIVDTTLTKDVEIRIQDTICHDIRIRQKSALELAKVVDLMLVIGGHSSANTKRLSELCSSLTETHLIDTFREIDISWLKQKSKIGLTSGTSTSPETINEVISTIKSVCE